MHAVHNRRITNSGPSGRYKVVKQQARFVRTTVSVPADLKKRMDKVAESVNWSALACRAFQDKLAEIAERKEKKEMGDVIERLRASKRKSDSEQSRDGYTAGQAWAERHAEAAELERLDSFVTCIEQDSSDWDGFLDASGSAYGPGERLYFALQPDDDGNRGAARDFWEGAARAEALDSLPGEFIRGFAEGALSVWHRVEDKL
jgi:hypothetical protein